MARKERRRLFAATSLSCAGYKPCSDLVLLSSSVFVYKSSSMFDVRVDGTLEKNQNRYLQTAIANNVVMVTMQFLKRTWWLLRKQIEYLPDFDSAVAVSGCGVLCPLPPSVVERVRRATVSRTVNRPACIW